MPPTQETQLRHDKSFSIDAKGGRGGGGRCLQTRAKQDRSFEACFFKKSLMDAKIFVNLCKSCEEGRNVEIVKTKKNNLRNDLGGLGVRKDFSAEK